MSAAGLDAFVFINFKQAVGFGHVAWGFALDNETYFYGSTDHLLRKPMWHVPALISYSSVRPGEDVDFWCGQGTLDEMLSEMATGPHIRYHAYKRLRASEPRGERARLMALGYRDGGWRLWDNNCVHQTARLLTAYGVPSAVLDAGSRLPVTSTLRAPVKWFAALAGEAIMLEPARQMATVRER